MEVKKREQVKKNDRFQCRQIGGVGKHSNEGWGGMNETARESLGDDQTKKGSSSIVG